MAEAELNVNSQNGNWTRLLLYTAKSGRHDSTQKAKTLFLLLLLQPDQAPVHPHAFVYGVYSMLETYLVYQGVLFISKRLFTWLKWRLFIRPVQWVTAVFCIIT